MELPTPEALYHYGFVLSVGNICFLIIIPLTRMRAECYLLFHQREVHGTTRNAPTYIFLIGEETK